LCRKAGYESGIAIRLSLLVHGLPADPLLPSIEQKFDFVQLFLGQSGSRTMQPSPSIPLSGVSGGYVPLRGMTITAAPQRMQTTPPNLEGSSFMIVG